MRDGAVDEPARARWNRAERVAFAVLLALVAVLLVLAVLVFVFGLFVES